MATIWIKEFTGGLDTRRLPETTPGGVMIRAKDGHVTRGGEFEKRAAFVPQFQLPAGTVGLAHTRVGLVVFGHAAAPLLPSGVAYQRLRHPDNVTALVAVPSYDLYDGLVYAVGEFADGSIHHFYNGVRVEDWYDGRARASFRVVSGSSTPGSPAVAATGSFTVTGGTSGAGNEITNLTVGGVAVIGAAVPHTGDNATTAAAVVTAINSFTSAPNYTASAVGSQVIITAASAGAAANGRLVVPTVGGDVTVGSVANMAGGVNAVAAVNSTLTALRVNGVDAIASPVIWAGSAEATAAAIATAINTATSSPEYTATAVGDTVNLVASVGGASENGKLVAFTVTNGLVLTPQTGLVLDGGGTTGGAQARGTFTIVSGSAGGTVNNVTVAGVSLISGPVTWAGSPTATAAAVAAAINAHVSTPDYLATSAGNVVTIVTADRTSSVNGVLPVITTTNVAIQNPNVAATASFTLSGTPQSDSASFGVRSATIRPSVNGVALTAAPVTAAATLAATASAVASAINSHTSSPNYTATASGATVTVTAPPGAAANGRTFSFAIVNQPDAGFGAISNPGTSLAATANGAFVGGLTQAGLVTAMTGGKDDDAFVPGTFVRTIKSKMYSVSDSLFHFSGIQEPTQWTTDAPGAGFVNMATQNSGSEQLTAVARYQNLVAIFSPEVVQVWFVDPDPRLNTVSQVLSNTGTSCPQSVTQFGDSDVFYLDESGLRSLRARDSSNAASTTDIGVPVDDLIAAKLASLTPAERLRVTGVINPIDKRFWLIMKDEVFVFSFYSNARVSAWTTYELSATTGGVKSPFTADHAVVWNRRVYIRSGNSIYVYGGVSGPLVYDETEAEVWLPYLDANRPTAKKTWEGIDVALTGLWEIKAAMEPTDLAAEEVVARAYRTTYNMHRVPFHASSSHISLRVASKGRGPAVLSAMAIHFAGDEDET